MPKVKFTMHFSFQLAYMFYISYFLLGYSTEGEVTWAEIGVWFWGLTREVGEILELDGFTLGALKQVLLPLPPCTPRAGCVCPSLQVRMPPSLPSCVLQYFRDGWNQLDQLTFFCIVGAAAVRVHTCGLALSFADVAPLDGSETDCGLRPSGGEWGEGDVLDYTPRNMCAPTPLDPPRSSGWLCICRPSGCLCPSSRRRYAIVAILVFIRVLQVLLPLPRPSSRARGKTQRSTPHPPRPSPWPPAQPRSAAKTHPPPALLRAIPPLRGRLWDT